MTTGSSLTRMVAFSACRAWLVILIAASLTAGAVVISVNRLSMNSNLDALFRANLPWKQRDLTLHRDFPQFGDQLVAVIDARIPEEADATAAALAAALVGDRRFVSVSRPDATPFFEREGLLFLDKPVLTGLLDQVIDAQPFLGQLAADPSARGLFAALSLVGMGVEHGQADLRSFAPALRAFHGALDQAATGEPQPFSWESVLTGKLSDLVGRYRFVLARPMLDYTQLQPGGAATDALRRAASGIEWVRTGQAHVRITGNVALGDEEIATATGGALGGLLASTGLVMLWLFLAVGGIRLVLPIMLTLLLGLGLTTGFAALAVGTLNLVSIAFAVLFVGIAVDFAIQFTMRFREMAAVVPDRQAALAGAARRAGPQILVAASATAAGFLSFVPTDFVGVAQLGLIAGMGMAIAFLCTHTVLPALLVVFGASAGGREPGLAWARPVDRFLSWASRPMLGLFAGLAVLGLVLLPRLVFDSDPLHTKNPNTEAMRTLRDLMDSPRTNPYAVEIIRPDAASAAALVPRLQALPSVAQAMSLTSFVPAAQPEKLALIADAANILGPTLTPTTPAAAITPADLRLAVQTAQTGLDRILPRLAQGDPLAQIDGDLRRLAVAPDARLMAMNAALTRFLPRQLGRLRLSLSAAPITLASIPDDVARDWRLPDGRTRVEAIARPAARSSAGLHAFVDQVRGIAPDAGGAAITVVSTAETVVRAFRDAVISALLAIAIILALALRRVRDVLLVLAPLMLSACLTVIVSVLLPLPLNFANVIALPLLLGVGVSFNIYFVMNWRAGQVRPLGSATARAVLFSALTTGTAFGSLALSAHPGTASMGRLLLVSLGCTLVASLIFVPALLAHRKP